MPEVFFAHANGIPAKTYQALFKHLEIEQVDYIEHLGADLRQPLKGWQPLVTNIIQKLEASQTQPVIGIGHSLGGYLLLWAYQKRPELFSQLVFLDPPIFRPTKRLVLGTVRAMGLAGRLIPPANKARMRKDTFDSIDEAYAYWRPKALFQSFDSESFDLYVKHALVANDSQYSLAIPKIVEYQIFKNTPSKVGKKNIAIPSHFIYGKSSDVLARKDVLWLQKKFTDTQFVPFSGGHMFPLDQPKQTAQLINQLI